MEKINCLLLLVCLVATIYSIDCTEDDPKITSSHPSGTSPIPAVADKSTTTNTTTTSTTSPVTNATSPPVTTPTSTPASPNSTTLPTPTSSSTTSSTSKPTPSPITTSTSSTSTLKPTTPSPTPAPGKQDRGFDIPSFIGGIILALGVLAISYVVYKFYRTRTDPTYRTL